VCTHTSLPILHGTVAEHCAESSCRRRCDCIIHIVQS